MQDVTKGLLNFQVSLTWGTVHLIRQKWYNISN